MFSGAVSRDRSATLLTDIVSAPSRFRKQAEDFEIEPDERDHQAKCAVPLHVFGSVHAGASFDHVEIENKIERRDDHDEKAKADADGTAAIDRGHLNVKEAQCHFCEIEDGDAAGRGDDAQLEALGRANHAGLVREQHYKQHAEGEANRLEGYARIGLLKDG